MSGLQEWIGKENSKFEYRNSKQARMSETEESSKRYDLDERTLRFARDVRAFKYMKSAGQAWVTSPFRKGEGLPLEPPSPPELEPLTLVLSPSPRGEAIRADLREFFVILKDSKMMSLAAERPPSLVPRLRDEGRKHLRPISIRLLGLKSI